MNRHVILAMVALRLRRVLRDRTALVWLLVMPMVFSLVMSQLLGNWSSSGQAPRPRFLVHAAGASPAVDRLLAGLRDNERFLLVEADTLVTAAQARAAVESGRLTAVLLIPAALGTGPAGDGADTLRLWHDSDRLSSQTVRTLLDRAVLRANTEASARSLVAPSPAAALPADRAAVFDQAAFDRRFDRPRVDLQVTALGRRSTERALALDRAAQHTSPAYTLFFVLMFLMTSAKDLVAERRDRTLARLTLSRASSVDLVSGFMLGAFVLGLLQTGILLLLNAAVFGLDYGDSPATLVLVTVLFAAVAAAGAVLLGSSARSEAQADGLGVGVTLVLAALGGLWWPLEIVPDLMKAAGHALPTGQAITIFHDMIGRGWGLAEAAPLLAGLAAWCAVLLVSAVVRLRGVVRPG
jgi:ABC-2 type transport system permease protein